MNKLLKVYKFYKGSFLLILFNELYFSFIDRFKFNIEPKGEIGFIPPIPTPYYYLLIARRFIKKNNIKSLIDIGSGTGRALNFFAKINNINLVGIEISEYCYNYSIKNSDNKIKYFKREFEYNKFDFFECYFMADTLREEKFFSFVKDLKEVSQKNHKNTYFFYINGYHWEKLINDSKLECIYNNYNIHNRGIGIFKIK